MAHAAADVLAGGPVAIALSGRERDPGPYAVILRLFGAVHGLVLTGQAPALAPYYPSVGGSADPHAAWPAFRQVCAKRRDAIRPWLDRPPQTNEIGRSAALLGGVLHVASATGLPVRLAELGASAGLNLRPDAVRVTWQWPATGSYGPATSPVVLPNAWTGALPPMAAPLTVVERRGCDLDPIVSTTPAGRVRLQSYVWPDDLDRMSRLRGAMELARQLPALVVRADAATYLAGLQPQDGTTLVVWHSIFWQYLPGVERRRVRAQLERLGAEATGAAPVAHLSLELEPTSDSAFVRLQLWPAGQFSGYGEDEVTIADTPPHGIPVRWRGPA